MKPELQDIPEGDIKTVYQDLHLAFSSMFETYIDFVSETNDVHGAHDQKAFLGQELHLDTSDPGCQTILQRASQPNGDLTDHTVLIMRDMDIGITQLLMTGDKDGYERHVLNDLETEGKKATLLTEPADVITLISAITRIRRGLPLPPPMQLMPPEQAAETPADREPVGKADPATPKQDIDPADFDDEEIADRSTSKKSKK